MTISFDGTFVFDETVSLPRGPVRFFINRHEYYLCNADVEFADGLLKFTNATRLELTSDRLRRMKRFRNRAKRRGVRHENERISD